jgi:hypothetical protein
MLTVETDSVSRVLCEHDKVERQAAHYSIIGIVEGSVARLHYICVQVLTAR